MARAYFFFRNVTHITPKIYLRNGSQTACSWLILKDFTKKLNKEQNLSTVKESFHLIKDKLKDGSAPRFERTSEEIITSGILSGSNDYALVLITVLRQMGIPTIFVQAAQKEWIRKLNHADILPKRASGYTFLEVNIEKIWYLLDPQRGILYSSYDYNNYSLPGGFYVFAKGRDNFETTSINMETNTHNMINCFKSFDLSKCQEPNYESTIL